MFYLSNFSSNALDSKYQAVKPKLLSRRLGAIAIGTGLTTGALYLIKRNAIREKKLKDFENQKIFGIKTPR
jgi:hypothetical protein